MYACLYILEIWNVKLYDYPELILIFYRLVTFKTLLNTLPSHSDQNSEIFTKSEIVTPALQRAAYNILVRIGGMRLAGLGRVSFEFDEPFRIWPNISAFYFKYRL